jgi:quercetin dioxygenase-like cupin family protein
MKRNETHPEVLSFSLGDEAMAAAQPELLRASGRSGSTLAKGEGLTVTILVLGPGGYIKEHPAEGSITIQPLSGKVTFTVEGVPHALEKGSLLFLPAGRWHSVFSDTGGSFLLTRMVP